MGLPRSLIGFCCVVLLASQAEADTDALTLRQQLLESEAEREALQLEEKLIAPGSKRSMPCCERRMASVMRRSSCGGRAANRYSISSLAALTSMNSAMLPMRAGSCSTGP